LINQKEENSLLLACSFGLMVPEYIIDSYQDKCFVMHPSLLPQYRGSSPISYALLNEDTSTGVSIVAMSKNKFDAGKIFY
jgi:methionyl-tRNA formyltransferase